MKNQESQLGGEAFAKLQEYQFESILDVGCGEDPYPGAVTIDLTHPAKFQDHYFNVQVDPVDLIWCCHVLEHQRNIGMFLEKMRNDLKPDGYACITIPPPRQNLVGGHVVVMAAGHLLYQMILAGFDCSGARVGTYGYNISVIVQRKDAILPPLLMDKGDIEVLNQFFPFEAKQGMKSDVENINW